MAGERIFSKHQWGIETTRGTPVAATRIIGADIGEIPLDREWQGVRLADGRRAQYNAKRYDLLRVNGVLSFSNLYFQALPGILQCSLDGDITPAEQTSSQQDYKWDIAPSMAAANAPDSLTLEMGDDTQAYEVEYCMFDSIRISAEIPADGLAPVKGEFKYFGRQLTPTTFTTSQSLHSGLELINAKLTRLYSDTAWAGIGGTELSSLLRGFELEILPGIHPKNFGSANRYFDSYGESKIGVLLTLDLEGGSSADAIFDLYQAGTDRAIRLALNGSQIGSGVNYKAQFDMFGFFQAVRPLSREVDGNNIHRALFVGKADSTGNFLDIDVITNHNTV